MWVIGFRSYRRLMTHNRDGWRADPPKGLWATVYAQSCGWHVVLHQTAGTIAGALKPRNLGVSCIPYKSGGAPETGYSMGMALAIGLINIVDEVPEECDRL